MLHGQEIYSFFNLYGEKGIYGIFLSSFLILLVEYKTFFITKKYKIKNYNEFLNVIVKNVKIQKILKIIINTFLLLSFYIMVAGFFAFAKQELCINELVILLLFCALCYYFFNNNIEKIIKINTILVPIIIIIFLILGVKNINNLNTLIIKEKNNWVFSSILYTSYNTITLIGVIVNASKYLKNEKECLKVSFFSGAIICFLAVIIFCLLLNLGDKAEIPMLFITNSYGGLYKYSYSIIICIAIFTTAISEGYTFIHNISNDNKLIQNRISLFLCTTAIPISFLGFSNLVNTIYPLFGIIGITQIIYILIKY